jgi:NADH-quinone oxidoreductase subunit H
VVAAQQDRWFVVEMPVAFVLYLAGVVGFSFWGPLSSAVGADLGGGVRVELSGVDRLVFVAGRYFALAAGAAFAVPLFLGGSAGPVLPGLMWTVAKTLLVVALLVWVRWRLPLIRPDRYVEVAWIVLVPLILAQALVTSLLVLAGR